MFTHMLVDVHKYMILFFVYVCMYVCVCDRVCVRACVYVRGLVRNGSVQVGQCVLSVDVVLTK